MTWRSAILGILGLGAAVMMPATVAGQAPEDSPWPQDWLDRGSMQGQEWRTRNMPPEQRKRQERHDAFMAAPHIEPYLNRTNPLPQNEDTINAGAAVYAEHCVECHGPNGFGNGEAGYALDPSPALLAFMVQMPRAVDGYLMWSVAEGGASFASKMPAYKDVLSDKEMWEVIAFMRSGFGAKAE